ncbi:MAG: DUF4105 domain-containing protein [Bacteroidaceae bacterium]|nr:DUF4105 domain-containing protein [Bacteroidaceae bacterium]
MNIVRDLAKRFLLLLFLVMGALGVTAQEENDIEISVVTCSPGTEVYQLYGHTALRVQQRSHGLDVVYNYGVFDFRAPHFLWRFVLGQCDYELAAYPYPFFLQDYLLRGSRVEEQVLNLTPAEAQRLLVMLMDNARSENKTYRYNFLTNNCTTKVRDMVERAVEGEVVYSRSLPPATYRDILHQFTDGYPWSQEGNDLLLGAQCDTVLTDRSSLFIPSRLQTFLRDAQVFDGMGNRRPLLRGENELLALRPRVAESSSWPAPVWVGVLFVALCTLLFAIERKWKRQWWLFDVLFLLAQGLVGVLLCFMFFFSAHPTVGSNWLVWPFNPLPLLCLPWVVRCAATRRFCLYHYVAAAVLALFAVFAEWIPQDISLMVILIVVGLVVRHVSYYFAYNHDR